MLDDLPPMLRILAATVLAKQNKVLFAELAFFRAENAFYRQQLPAQRFTFSRAWKRRFAEVGAALGWKRLREICTVAAVRTFQRWNSELKRGVLGIALKRGTQASEDLG